MYTYSQFEVELASQHFRNVVKKMVAYGAAPAARRIDATPTARKALQEDADL